MNTKRYYIGLAATFHDPAIAIVNPAGEIIFAEAAERYLQDKRAFNCPPDHFMRAPTLIKTYCEPEVELVLALSWSKSWLRSLRFTVALANFVARFKVIQTQLDRWSLETLWPSPKMRHKWAGGVHTLAQAGHNIMGSKELSQTVHLKYFDHHLCHAANACYTSPFTEGLCAVVNGYGEWKSTAFFHYHEGQLRDLKKRSENDSGLASLGLFYEIVCVLCGFDPFKGEEWKVMYITLPALPFTPHGKLGHHALAPPQPHVVPKHDYVAPQNSVEKELLTLWQTTLQLEQVGIDDNFFEAVL